MPHLRSIHGDLQFKLPDAWRLINIAAFAESDPGPGPTALCARALAHPIGAPQLDRLLSPGQKVAILIEDLTRASPKRIVLEGVLAALARIGIAPADTRIIIALGTHRGLSPMELEATYGKTLIQTYSFFNHDCRADDLVMVGRLQSGTPVKINRLAWEADFRIGIGSIFPHPMNGFGGGGKILFPGVADLASIFEHHLRHSFRGRNDLGNTDGNSFHQEVCDLALAGRLDFIVNSVLDHNDRLHDLVCGDPVAAHQAGIRICRGIISKTFRAISDITLISAFPYTEGPQIMKPLAPAGMITRKGGTVILQADCTVPLPEIYFQASEKFRAANSGRLAVAVRRHFADQRPIIPEGPPELNMSLAQCLLALNDYRIILVTRDIPKQHTQRLGFEFADTIDAAIRLAADDDGAPTVNIVPSGGVILPLVETTPP